MAGIFFHPTHSHPHTDHPIDFINPDCHLLGKKSLVGVGGLLQMKEIATSEFLRKKVEGPQARDCVRLSVQIRQNYCLKGRKEILKHVNMKKSLSDV